MLGASVHRKVYIVLLALLGGCMVTSVWASNLVWTLLGVNWLMEGQWAAKWERARRSRLLQAVAVLVLMHAVGLLWSSDLAAGVEALRIKLPLLVVPLVVLTSRPVAGNARRAVLAVYAATVLVVSVIGAVRLVTLPDLPYREAVPYISHIRFALNCCVVLYLMGGILFSSERSWPAKAVAAAVGLWMIGFMLMLRSYTGIAAVAVVSIVSLAAMPRRAIRARMRAGLIGLWIVVVGGVAAGIAHEARAYYRLSPKATAPLPELTASGHRYDHAQDGIVENGNYINNYICHEELEAEWGRRSAMPLTTPIGDGLTMKVTLVRYLNALGLDKDSAGLSRLTEAQVRDVERGISNPVYSTGNAWQKMVCTLLFEYECYRKTGTVRNSSMLERVELWKAAVATIGDHPWVGVGTGDMVAEMHNCLAARQSAIADTWRTPHNQYLSLAVMFGLVGAAILLLMFLRACQDLGRQPVFILLWVLTVLVSFLTEDTLNTLTGILFCTYFIAFRKDNVPISHPQ